MERLIENGLYKVQDRYFVEFSNKYLIQNKCENRPFYYLLKDHDGIDWAIPLSSQVENYKKKIAREEQKRGEGNCIYYHIGEIASRERVFLISEMIPIDESYIKEPFLIDRPHYISRNQNQNRKVRSKAMRYLQLLKSGRLSDTAGRIMIRDKLLERRK